MTTTSYNSGVRHCIENNAEWLKKELSGEEFTMAETERILVCADEYYKVCGVGVLAFLSVFIAIVIATIIWVRR